MLPLTSALPILSAERIAEATGGRLVRGKGAARAVTIDSRRVLPGELFIALSGERHDGHDFIAAAVARGADGLVVERLPDAAVTGEAFVVVVADTRQALLDLAAAWRLELTCSVAAITGTCGKTSTKELAAHLLAPHLSLVAAAKSFNNEIGVPLTLFRATPTTELCLLEIGTNQRGEIARLARVARPDVAIVTAVGRGHLEGLGSVAGVVEEKGDLIEAVAAGGCAVLNADDRHFAELRARAGAARVVTFGVNREADVRGTALRPQPGGVAFELRLRGEPGSLPVELPQPGLHSVRNLLAAVALGHVLGVPVEAMLQQAATLRPAPRRLEPKRTKSGIDVLDDSYNANPESLLAALAVLDTQPCKGRKVLVLGDMLELGAESAAIHRSFGAQIAGRVDVLVTVGPLAALTGSALRATQTRVEVHGVSSVDDLHDSLPRWLTPGDLVLFRGSRRVALDRAVDALVPPEAAVE